MVHLAVKENKLLWIASLLWESMKVQLQFTSIAKTNSDSDTDSYTHTDTQSQNHPDSDSDADSWVVEIY